MDYACRGCHNEMMHDDSDEVGPGLRGLLWPGDEEAEQRRVAEMQAVAARSHPAESLLRHWQLDF